MNSCNTIIHYQTTESDRNQTLIVVVLGPTDKHTKLSVRDA